MALTYLKKTKMHTIWVIGKLTAFCKTNQAPEFNSKCSLRAQTTRRATQGLQFLRQLQPTTMWSDKWPRTSSQVKVWLIRCPSRPTPKVYRIRCSHLLLLTIRFSSPPGEVELQTSLQHDLAKVMKPSDSRKNNWNKNKCEWPANSKRWTLPKGKDLKMVTESEIHVWFPLWLSLHTRLQSKKQIPSGISTAETAIQRKRRNEGRGEFKKTLKFK